MRHLIAGMREPGSIASAFAWTLEPPRGSPPSAEPAPSERQSAGSQAVVFMGLEPGRSLMAGLRDSHQRDPYCDATNECEKQRPLNQNMLFPRDSRHCDELIG